MGAAKYVLAVVSVFLLGTAAGSFAHHKDGTSYTVPILLAVLGIAAAVAAWKSDSLVRRFSKPRDGGKAGDKRDV